MSRFVPKAHLSANTNNWGVYHVAAGPLNPVIPAPVAKVFDEKRKAIIWYVQGIEGSLPK